MQLYVYDRHSLGFGGDFEAQVQPLSVKQGGLELCFHALIGSKLRCAFRKQNPSF